MQHLMNLSLYEIRRDEYAQEMARVNREGWKSVRGQGGREAVAKALVALATRIAPGVVMLSAKTRAVVQ